MSRFIVVVHNNRSKPGTKSASLYVRNEKAVDRDLENLFLNIDRGATGHYNNGHLQDRTSLNLRSSHRFYLDESCMCEKSQG